MTDTDKVNPRARFWRDQKVAAADQLSTTRALDHDAAGQKPALGRSARRSAARAFWRRPYIWEKPDTAL